MMNLMKNGIVAALVAGLMAVSSLPVMADEIPASAAPTAESVATESTAEADNTRTPYSVSASTSDIVGSSGLVGAAWMENNFHSIYRLYNPNAKDSGSHHYTMNPVERDYLISLGWRYEGIMSYAIQPSSETHNLQHTGGIGAEVIRFYNPNTGEHLFSDSRAEQTLLKNAGWSCEGVAWLEVEEEGVWHLDDNDYQAVEVYRTYNPNAKGGDHFYTTNLNEKNYLVSVGWKFDGVAFDILYKLTNN
jgi:hypothetical protein